MFKKLISKEYLWGLHSNSGTLFRLIIKYIIISLASFFYISAIKPDENTVIFLPIIIFWLCQMLIWPDSILKNTIISLICYASRDLKKVATTEYIFRFTAFLCQILISGVFIEIKYQKSYLFGIIIGMIFVLSSNLYIISGSLSTRLISFFNCILLPFAIITAVPYFSLELIIIAVISLELITFIYCIYIFSSGFKIYKIMENLSKEPTLEIDE